MAAAININIRLVRLSSTVCPSIFALTHPGCTCLSFLFGFNNVRASFRCRFAKRKEEEPTKALNSFFKISTISQGEMLILLVQDFVR